MPATQEITQVGKHEDLSDMLVYTNAGDMPFTSMVRKGSEPGNTLMQYPIDKYDTPRTDGVIDGKDYESTEDAQKNRRILYSRVQKWWRIPRVTDMAQNVSRQAGSPNPMQQAKATKLFELKTDMESTFMSDNDSQEDTGAVPYLTRGMGSWISASAQTDLPVPTEYLVPAGQIYSSAIGSFTEASLRTLLQTRWETLRSSKTLYGFLASNVKNAVSDFARYEADKSGFLQVRRFNQASPTEVVNTVDVYKGDYGRVICMLQAYMPNVYRGYILDMDKLELRMSRNPRSEDKQDNGGGPTAIIDAIGALINRHPQSHIKIAATA